MTASPLSTDEQAIGQGYRQNFDRFNDVLHTTKYDRYLRFFNFGYAPLEGEEHFGPHLGRNYPNRDSALLLFQVVGDAPLSGATVLEVGCGRGGNLGLLMEHYDVGRVFGTDIAFNSMAYCQNRYPADRAAFFQADAQFVAVRDAAVDVVVNVESSGCYPDVERFFRDVSRVLKPGGWFLYADLMARTFVPRYREVFTALGLDVVGEKDVTANVAESRKMRAERQLLAFGDGKAPEGMEEWVGADGSTLNDVLTGGKGAYQVFRCQRSDRAADPAPQFTPEEHVEMTLSAAEGVELLRLGAPGA